MGEIREQTLSQRRRVVRMAAVIFVLVLCISAIFVVLITRSITRPVHKLCDAAEEIGQGHLDTRIHIASGNELSVVGESFNRMAQQITILIEDIREEQIYNRNMEQKLLQAQINPHFLYNTLDNILWLSEAGRKEEVQALVMSLSQFFRTTLSGGRDIITLREEISHVEAYLQIQKFRYQDILSYEIDVPQDLMEVPVIKMTLQPIVENALYHGIKNKRGMGLLTITAFEENSFVCIRVSDNGIGMKEEDLQKVQEMVNGTRPPEEDNTGFGLANAAQRLRLNFGEAYRIQIESVYGEGTSVTVYNPKELPENRNSGSIGSEEHGS
jgi:two-component system sensor histidine kinase YesM